MGKDLEILGTEQFIVSNLEHDNQIFFASECTVAFGRTKLRILSALTTGYVHFARSRIFFRQFSLPSYYVHFARSRIFFRQFSLPGYYVHFARSRIFFGYFQCQVYYVHFARLRIFFGYFYYQLYYVHFARSRILFRPFLRFTVMLLDNLLKDLYIWRLSLGIYDDI